MPFAVKVVFAKMPCSIGSTPVTKEAWFGYVDDGKTEHPPCGA
jgi:hypothetical protein